MKKILLFAIALCTIAVAANAQKKEKKEKAPKTYEWTWDGTKSGNEKVDDYLVTVDTLWNQIKDFKANQETYEYKRDTLLINDKIYIANYMKTNEGKLVTRATCNWQLVNSITTGMKLGGQALKAASLEANATAALPSLGMKALSYGKYLKGGLNIISMAKDEISRVVKIQKDNAQAWKSLKDGALDEVQLAQIIDKDGNRVFDDDAVKNMKRCMYVKEVQESDPEYPAVREKIVAKPEEQQQQEAAELAAAAKAPVNPEEANQTAADLPGNILAD